MSITDESHKKNVCRMGKKGKGKTRNSFAVSDDVPSAQKKLKKDKKLSKSSVIYNDGAKYMSYIKVSSFLP